MATKATVQSETRPQWTGHLRSPSVTASMVINVVSNRNEESLKARMERIKFFVENDHEPAAV